MASSSGKAKAKLGSDDGGDDDDGGSGGGGARSDRAGAGDVLDKMLANSNVAVAAATAVRSMRALCCSGGAVREKVAAALINWLHRLDRDVVDDEKSVLQQAIKVREGGEGGGEEEAAWDE